MSSAQVGLQQHNAEKFSPEGAKHKNNNHQPQRGDLTNDRMNSYQNRKKRKSSNGAS